VQEIVFWFMRAPLSFFGLNNAMMSVFDVGLETGDLLLTVVDYVF
jgi:hypothetical protein